MTRPKRHLPGEKVLITRRTHNKEHLLESNLDVHELVDYALALYAPLYGIEIHAVVVMSNHLHMVITDLYGQRALFMRSFFSLIARARNYQLKRRDAFWSTQPPGDCVLLDEDVVWRKCLYTWENPIKARLTNHLRAWGGFHIDVDDWCKPRCVSQPNDFFTRSTLPKTATYSPCPPSMDERSDKEVLFIYQEKLKDSFATPPPKNMRTATTSLRSTRPQPPPEASRQLNPLYAGSHINRQTYKNSLETFRSLHAEARKRIKEGKLEQTSFPLGTISMKQVMPWLIEQIKDNQRGSLEDRRARVA